jgi:hypothetical protein
VLQNSKGTAAPCSKHSLPVSVVKISARRGQAAASLIRGDAPLSLKGQNQGQQTNSHRHALVIPTMRIDLKGCIDNLAATSVRKFPTPLWTATRKFLEAIITWWRPMWCAKQPVWSMMAVPKLRVRAAHPLQLDSNHIVILDLPIHVSRQVILTARGKRCTELAVAAGHAKSHPEEIYH